MDDSRATEYHPVTKLLHWGIFFLLAAQFFVGYTLEELDEGDHSEDRLFILHASLGSTILLLSIFRIIWRRRRPLPAWASTLSPFERRYSHWVERFLYVLMVAIPLSGLALAVAVERPLPLVGEVEISEELEDSDVENVFEAGHIASHLAFFAALTLHIGLVIKHQVFDRDGLLRRML